MESTRMFRAAVSRPVAIAIAAALLYAVFIWRCAFRIDGETFFSLFDDAMISMRYARNFVEGRGLAWNPGGPAVEGYTNLLWTLWMAVIHPFSPESKVSLIVMLSSCVCLLANLFLVGRLATRASDGDAEAKLCATTLAAFSFPLMFWSLRGMEVGFLTMLIGAGALLGTRLSERYSARDFWLLCGVFVLALLTRPDSAIPVVVLSAFVWWSLPREQRLRVGLALPAVLFVTIAAHTAFREGYYHELLPNTYYLKATGTPLLVRVRAGLLAFVRLSAFELWPLLVMLTVPVRDRPLRLGLVMLSVLFAGQCAYSIYMGGDAWEELRFSNRYIAIALPAAFVVASTRLMRARDSEGLRTVARRLVVTGLSAAAFVVVYRYVEPVRRIFEHEFYQMNGRRFIAYVAADLVVVFAASSVLVAPGFINRRIGSTTWLTAAALLAMNGTAFAGWAVENAPYLDSDTEMTRLGVELRHDTSENATIAVVWAGAPAYFAHRNAVDLLGKNDPVVARQPPHSEFRPGHNKWDMHYSIEKYHPDLILQTFRLSPEEREFLRSVGYQRLDNGIYVARQMASTNIETLNRIPIQMRHLFEVPES